MKTTQHLKPLTLLLALFAFQLFSFSAFCAVTNPIPGRAMTVKTNLIGNERIRIIDTNASGTNVDATISFTNILGYLNTNLSVSGGSSGSNFVQIGLGAAPTAATNAVRLVDLQSASNAAITAVNTASNALRAGNLVFLLTFDQTNGVGSNVVAAATPRVGRFLHATREAGNPPNSLVPMITNRSLTYQPISNAGTIYLGYSAVGPIQRVKMVFRMRETYGTGPAVSPYVHLVGNGEFVASSDLFAHGGFSPQFGVVEFDGHLGGFGAFSQPKVSTTNENLLYWTFFEGLGRLNTFEYWRTGTNVAGHVNGWPFILPYTNALAFTNQTNLIVQFFANSQNALSARNPEIVSIAAWDSPYPSVDNEALPDGMVNPVFYGATVYRNLTNAPGSRIQGAGSNSIETITLLTASNITVVGGTLNLDNDQVVGTLTNAATNIGGLYSNATFTGTLTNGPGSRIVGRGSNSLESVTTLTFTNASGGVLTISSAFTNTGTSALLGGGTLTGVFSGAGNSVLTNLTSIGVTNLTLLGGRINQASFVDLQVAGVTRWSVQAANLEATANIRPSAQLTFDLGAAGQQWRSVVASNYVASGTLTTTNGVYYTTNSLTATAVLAGLTNGGTWVGMISNGLHAAYMSNGVTFWTLITTNR